ncbi:TetR/AcrR family transcriptional regulator [Clavibacter michiganensis]|uniref:TetR/AcrR family transcriptional regulator n=1 Tax=Clavibacter michiganensis TaxID=28447 RepID=UPI001430FA2A|nr:TetR/AcrR family transcriptional regulator [Clavibacter michiganensis]MBW8026226.1 TetR/AcrR family transcriptional regulator [Clavibacter michiganensis subsp. michiganensis]MDO4045292.1 helix-turn-helix domain-containing protein [Clavibacter michiganensis]MDO4054418.1 helix-turn-helix domain-containing protein [Clavibacter michiganensis]MDO4057668.1 helix-turn-helix domain-containing protein [Clavibacter michiganensis]MDO4069684.1 helix-turn-helix domain-containing protein [Clavibacter mic
MTESRSAAPRRRASSVTTENFPHAGADAGTDPGPGEPPGSTARGLYSTGVRRRAEIVAAAVRVFGVRGYGAATIKEIADEVGVSPAAVLRYFRKEELLTEVLRQWDRQQPFVSEAAAGLPALRAFVDLMRYHVEHRGFLELYLTFATETSDATHPAHEYMRGRYARTIAQIRRRIGEAVALGQVPPMDDATLDYESACFLAILDGLEIQWIHNPSLDLPALVGEYVEQSIARWRGGTRAAVAPGSASWG